MQEVGLYHLGEMINVFRHGESPAAYLYIFLTYICHHKSQNHAHNIENYTFFSNLGVTENVKYLLEN